MGVGLSSEVSTKLSRHQAEAFDEFIATNRKELLYLIEQLKATEELAERGITFGDDGGEGDGGNGSGVFAGTQAASESKSFTEKELADMFSPYEDIWVPNRYLSDLALLLPLKELRDPHFSISDYMETLTVQGLTDIVTAAAARRRGSTGADANGNSDEEEGEEEEAEAEGTDALMVLSRNAYLRSLDLSFNSLHGSVSMAALVDSLGACHSLTHLSLAGNAVEGEGCELLGRWLASNPPLRSLTLSHSDLCDVFVCPSLFPNALITNTNLRFLDISFTDITDATVLALLQSVGCDGVPAPEASSPPNTTLAVVLVESVLHDRDTQLPVQSAYNDSNNSHYTNTVMEYACASDGLFRSGYTYCQEVDREGNDDGEKGGRGSPASSPSSSAVGENDAEASRAAKERFELRKAFLKADLAGRATLSPTMCALLYNHLAPRRHRYVEELKSDAFEQRVRRGGRGSSAVAESGLHAGGPDGSDDAAAATGGLGGGDTALQGKQAEELGSRHSESEFQVGSKALLKSLRGASTHRRNHFQSIYTENDVQRAIDGSKRRGSLKRSLPPFNTPERLSLIREDIQNFKASHSTSKTDPTGDRVGEKTLHNGFDVVYMPPVRESGAQSRNEIVIQEMPRRLRPCWCSPSDASLPYAGILHYHCVCEEYIEYGRDSAKDSSRGAGAGTGTGTGTGGQRKSKSKKKVESFGLDVGNSDTDDVDVYKRPPYHGCQGTGHHCSSGKEPQSARYQSKFAQTRTRKFNGDRYTIYHSDHGGAAPNTVTASSSSAAAAYPGSRTNNSTQFSSPGGANKTQPFSAAGVVTSGGPPSSMKRTLPPLSTANATARLSQDTSRRAVPSRSTAKGVSASGPGSVVNENTQHRYNPVEYFSSAFQPSARVIAEEYSF